VTQTPVLEILTEKFDPNVCRFKTSRVSEWIVRSVDPERIIHRRRENFMALHNQIGGVVQPVFDRLPAGVCPLFYAIKVDNNRETMSALRQKGVEAWAWWWPTHPRLAHAECDESRNLRKQVVVIPCHEGISANSVTRIAQVVTTVLGK
jgi:dTDP-4-amino-4,6-dideoxygalactose transaminase